MDVDVPTKSSILQFYIMYITHFTKPLLLTLFHLLAHVTGDKIAQ